MCKSRKEEALETLQASGVISAEYFLQAKPGGDIRPTTFCRGEPGPPRGRTRYDSAEPPGAVERGGSLFCRYLARHLHPWLPCRGRGIHPRWRQCLLFLQDVKEDLQRNGVGGRGGRGRTFLVTVRFKENCSSALLFASEERLGQRQAPRRLRIRRVCAVYGNTTGLQNRCSATH